MNESILSAGARRSRRRARSSSRSGLVLSGAGLATIVLSALVLVLPLMMGHRTPETLTATALLLTGGAALAWLLAAWPGAGQTVPTPTAGWWWVFGLISALCLLQVMPSSALARLFGPYPEALWNHPEYAPRHWSPNPGATLRGWAVFAALFAVAWLAGSLPCRARGWLWLAIMGMALFQALYGLVSHASGAISIFGIWDRHSVDFVQGSFSNRNVFAGYLALTWPLVVAVWWLREVPLLSRLPVEMKVAGSVISGAIIGAALMGSASRLGTTAGVIGMLTALLLWTRYRGHLSGGSVWPAWLAALAAFLFATWYGLAPLTDRLAMTSSVDAVRFEVVQVVLNDVPLIHWLAGVGLGGFEAVFKSVQPASIGGWWDYAHNDLLQWLLEAGLVGWLVLGLMLAALFRYRAVRLERVALYAGLVALVVVGLGDFSWHIPGTQVVLAIYLGVLLRPPPRRRGDRRAEEDPELLASERPRRRRRRRSRPSSQER